MFTAMFVRKTRVGCRESVIAAIESLSSQEDKQYLRKEWLSNIDSWALCARNQVTTTNNLESWAQIAQKRGRDLVRSSHGYTRFGSGEVGEGICCAV